jgi:hypothetical protein
LTKVLISETFFTRMVVLQTPEQVPDRMADR